MATHFKDKLVELTLTEISDNFGISMEDLMSRKRPESIAFPRQIAMYILMNYGFTSSQAAAALNRNDHGTALHAQKLVRERMGQREYLRELIKKIDQKVLKLIAPDAMQVLS